MITIDELKAKLNGMKTSVDDLRDALSIEASEKRLAELEHQMTMPGFYDDQEKSQKVIGEMGEVKNKLERFGKLSTQYEEAETLLLMIEEENDPALTSEGEQAVADVEKAIDELQLMTMLNGEYDHNNAILTFHAGTGGTEAQDWAEMLYRMYTRWAEAHGYNVEVLGRAGRRRSRHQVASMMVKGPNAYGMLKSEHGVHRLVRISPFDANARRQTSFASLEVMPELDNNIQIEINPADIEMQVYRSSGAGGQHINKTSSAVRLIHKPTGIVTSCQTQRSQLQNREYALEMMKAKLYQIALQQHKDKIDDIKGVQNEIAWGTRSAATSSCPTPSSRTTAPTMRAATCRPSWTATGRLYLRLPQSQLPRRTAGSVSGNPQTIRSHAHRAPARRAFFIPRRYICSYSSAILPVLQRKERALWLPSQGFRPPRSNSAVNRAKSTARPGPRPGRWGRSCGTTCAPTLTGCSSSGAHAGLGGVVAQHGLPRRRVLQHGHRHRAAAARQKDHRRADAGRRPQSALPARRRLGRVPVGRARAGRRRGVCRRRPDRGRRRRARRQRPGQ